MSYTNGLDGMSQGKASVSEVSPASLAENVRGSKAADNVSSDVRHADSAQLSTAAGSIAQAMETSDVRMDKVASLQQAIGAGTYNVSSQDVADKIVQSLTK